MNFGAVEHVAQVKHVHGCYFPGQEFHFISKVARGIKSHGDIDDFGPAEAVERFS